MVSATTQLKLRAADGKKYYTDMLDANGIILLAKSVPNLRATALLQGALTDRINDREMFMKGIDYSYYYAQED